MSEDTTTKHNPWDMHSRCRAVINQQKAEIERLRAQRDEAREAARWTCCALRGRSAFQLAIERWPWLE